MTHIWVIRLTIIGSDNGLLPDQRQAIIRTNATILLMGLFSEFFYQNLFIFIHKYAFENGACKMATILPQAQCINIETEPW